MAENTADKKTLKDQDRKSSRAPGKVHMTALWLSTITALATNGLPKVAELLANKPSTEQVQQIVAGKMNEVVNQLNRVINDLHRIERDLPAVRANWRAIVELRADLHVLSGALESLGDRHRINLELPHKLADATKAAETRSSEATVKIGSINYKTRRVKPLKPLDLQQLQLAPVINGDR